jgi:hypothetical protein
MGSLFTSGSNLPILFSFDLTIKSRARLILKGAPESSIEETHYVTF